MGVPRTGAAAFGGVGCHPLVGRSGRQDGGDEEFGILVRRCQVEDATRVAEKVRAAVSGNPCPIGGSSVTVWLSAGVACSPDHGTTAAEIFRARSIRRGQLVRVAHRQRRHVPGVIVSKE
ncbi:MAG: diguanylate cyclase [Gemmatimonadetes bacterium]|nr:diguanylate cyclase [Gemmatimonadota bacterium]